MNMKMRRSRFPALPIFPQGRSTGRRIFRFHTAPSSGFCAAQPRRDAHPRRSPKKTFIRGNMSLPLYSAHWGRVQRNRQSFEVSARVGAGHHTATEAPINSHRCRATSPEQAPARHSTIATPPTLHPLFSSSLLSTITQFTYILTLSTCLTSVLHMLDMHLPSSPFSVPLVSALSHLSPQGNVDAERIASSMSSTRARAVALILRRWLPLFLTFLMGAFVGVFVILSTMSSLFTRKHGAMSMSHKSTYNGLSKLRRPLDPPCLCTAVEPVNVPH